MQVCVYTSWIVRSIVVQQRGNRIIIDSELSLGYDTVYCDGRIKDFVDVPQVQSYFSLAANVQSR